MKVYTNQDHIEMINDEDRWPCWPALPVKNNQIEEVGDIHPICGLIFSGNLTTVVKLNLFMGFTEELYNKAKKWKYNSVEELIADGWVVD